MFGTSEPLHLERPQVIMFAIAGGAIAGWEPLWNN